MDLAVGHARGFREKVRHVPVLDRDVDDRALLWHADETVGHQRAVVHVVAEEHPLPGTVAVEHDVGHLSRLVRALVRDQLEVVEPVEPAVELGSRDPHGSGPDHPRAPGVGRLERNLELARLLRAQRDLQVPVLVRLGCERLERLLRNRRVVLTGVDHARDDHLAFGLHRRVVRSQRPDPCEDLLPRRVVPAIRGHKGIELVAGSLHCAPTGDRASARVADFGLDTVDVVRIRVVPQSLRGVDTHIDGAVLADLGFALLHQLALRLVSRPPPWPPADALRPPTVPPTEPVVVIPH